MTPEACPPLDPQEQAWASGLAAALRGEIGRALVGQQAVVDQVLATLLASGHVLLEGAPGLGKTLLVRALARAIQGGHARIQFTPDLMPSDVTGHAVYDGRAERFHVRQGPVFTHLLLADEVNRAPAKTQAALLEVMQEQQVTLEGQALPVPRPFMVLATQNPIEQEGTYPLPEAQLDRFLLKVTMDYPSPDEENALVRRVTAGRPADRLDAPAVHAVATPEAILRRQAPPARARAADAASDYAVGLARATRAWAGISLGAGPRGGIALVRAARAHALLEGRAFAAPDDVKALALPALRHRIAPSPEAEIEGQDVDQLLEALLDNIDAPRA